MCIFCDPETVPLPAALLERLFHTKAELNPSINYAYLQCAINKSTAGRTDWDGLFVVVVYL